MLNPIFRCPSKLIMPGKRRASTRTEENSAKKVRKTQNVPKTKQEPVSYAKDEIVWCDLGHSYGWWPGMITNTKVRFELS